MAEWKKVIVSGSNAELNQVTASFFSGDGSALTNVPAGSVNIESFDDGTGITVDAANDKLLISDGGSEKYVTVDQVVSTAIVTSAGALMDSEVDADIKTLSLPASTTISTFGASLIDDAAASNARTTLGLGSLATASEITVDEINSTTLIISTDSFEDTDDTKIPTVRAVVGAGFLTSVSNNNWSGTDLAVTNGGTGASNASGARTNLGLAIGSDVQAYDAGLAAIAGLATTDGGIIVGNGSTFVLETGATARTSLGLAIGTDVQAYDAGLAAIAGLATTDGGFIVGNGSTFVLETAGTARTSLGLGSLATLSTINNSNWSGTDLAVVNGGTGASNASGARTNLGLGNVENTALSTYTGEDGALDNQFITNGAGYVTSNTMGSGFTVSATTDTTATTITQGDDLFFRAGTGITCETTADGEVTIASTVTNTNTMGNGFTVSATTDSTAVTIQEEDDLFFRAGNGITCETTNPGEVTITNTITNNTQLTNGSGYTTNTGTVTGTGVSNRVARWSGTTSISSVSDLTFDGVNLVAGSDGATGGRVRTGDGSSSNPAFSFVGDTNTGFYNSTTDTIAASCGGAQRLTISGNGLKVNTGALGVNVNPSSTTDGRIDASNDIVAYSSDKRLKENIKLIEKPLDKLDKLSGFTFNWNEKAEEVAGFDREQSMVGVFAQDVESVLPQAVKRAPFDNDGNDGSISGEKYLTVQYEKIVPLLIESIKELKAEIEELKGRL